MSNDGVIWVMDSDLCEECGQLLDEWAICTACGWSDNFGFEEEEQDDPWWDEQDEDDRQDMSTAQKQVQEAFKVTPEMLGELKDTNR